jgi:hypothetical protein
MATVRMGSAEEYLRLTAQGWPTEGHQHPELTEAPNQRFLKAELHLARLSAVRVIDLPRDLGGLPEFFDGVAERWQDLELGVGLEPGEVLEWLSYERDLRIGARRIRPGGTPEHRGPDYVWLYVTLRDLRSWRVDDWTVRAVLTIQPADHLHAIAQGVHALAGPLD